MQIHDSSDHSARESNSAATVPTGEILRDHLAVLAGRTVAVALRIVRPGGGTALPGMVANRISPGLLPRILARPREGIVVVTGSSGKSTTTHMLAAILRQHGLSVFTNNRTANITKGLVSELLPHLDRRNQLRVDVAVLEIDEGYSALITEQVPARVSVLLNVMIDQLHRWHEPERVAGYLARTAAATDETVVINEDDPHLAAIGATVENALGATEVRRFSLASELTPASNQIRSALRFGDSSVTTTESSDSSVVEVSTNAAVIRTNGADLQVELPTSGAHIASDAAAAIEGARAVLGDRFDAATTQLAFQEMTGVAGRHERVTINGHTAELIFTKSPASMQINVDLLDGTAEQVMVAVGKDIFDSSQLWLVDWSTLPDIAVVSGWQAWDTALRLAYDEVEVTRVEPDIHLATRDFMNNPSQDDGHSTIIYTPEAMRVMRRNLKLDRTVQA
jgi:UDP-N-acetylmuramyl tripeptide synthase